MSREILDPTAQHNIINKTTTLEGYKGVTDRLFMDSGRWCDSVENYNRQTGSVDYRLMNLTGLVIAQFGFPLLGGQYIRHDRRGWNKHPLSSEHQLALAIYMAGLNTKSYPIKEDVITHLSDPSLEPGVWGTHMRVEGGKIISRGLLQRDSAERRARKRIQEDGRTICLPDRDLNNTLAAIEFDGDTADQIPEEEFRHYVLPQVQGLLGELVR